MINNSFGIVAVLILFVAPLVCYLSIEHDKVVELMDGTALQALYRYRSSSDGYYVISFDDNIENITERANYLQQIIPELKVRHVFPQLKAVAIATLSVKHLDYIQSVAKVTSIEPDYIVEAMRVQKLQNITMSWGIDRIDGKIDQKYQYAYTGKGVRVYIIDSGIKFNHNEFNTLSQNNATKRRAKCGKNLRKDLGENCNDEWGHGTHVAAIIVKLFCTKGNFLKGSIFIDFERTGGKTYGVAKDVNLVALKVFGADGKSRFSDIIAALEYVIYRKKKEPNVPIVVNMSLGTERKAMLLNKAVDKATEAGITVVVAAGNGGKNACTYSPASASSAITVAASTFEDKRLSYSNWGRCVDLYAPGERIWSAWRGKQTAASFQTGTSSATPYVSGAVALYLERNASMTPNEIKNALRNDAFLGLLSNKTNSAKFLPFRLRKETPNLLLNVGVFRRKVTRQLQR